MLQYKAAGVIQGDTPDETPMAIPTDFDRQLGAIGEIANGITVRLTTMRWAGKGARDIEGLRDQLQAFVDAVMAMARTTEP